MSSIDNKLDQIGIHLNTIIENQNNIMLNQKLIHICLSEGHEKQAGHFKEIIELCLKLDEITLNVMQNTEISSLAVTTLIKGNVYLQGIPFKSIEEIALFDNALSKKEVNGAFKVLLDTQGVQSNLTKYVNACLQACFSSTLTNNLQF